MSLHDPNIPNISRKWCADCLGHYPIKIAGSGRHQITVCAKCESVNVWNITPVTLWIKLLYSIPFFMPFLIGVNAHFNLSDFRLAGLTAWQAYAFALVFGVLSYLIYRRKVSARKKWLIWAKERGFSS